MRGDDDLFAETYGCCFETFYWREIDKGKSHREVLDQFYWMCSEARQKKKQQEKKRKREEERLKRQTEKFVDVDMDELPEAFK